MIKTILVPASGSSTDEPVFATALAAARALAAHLDFYTYISRKAKLRCARRTPTSAWRGAACRSEVHPARTRRDLPRRQSCTSEPSAIDMRSTFARHPSGRSPFRRAFWRKIATPATG